MYLSGNWNRQKMKLLKIEYLINRGSFAESAIFQQLLKEIKIAIAAVKNPKGSQEFSIFPVKQANGVVPIKESCMLTLEKAGWNLEARMRLGSRLVPGPVDAVKSVGENKYFAVEWETGNISSSHRALNKMALGMLDGTLLGGILILPSRDLYFYLTDRIGNFAEIEPYFPIWKNICCGDGVLAVIEIEHDKASLDVPKIPKGTDGRALV